MSKGKLLLIVLLICVVGGVILLFRRHYVPLHSAVVWFSRVTPINLEAGLIALESSLGTQVTTNPLSILGAAGSMVTVAGAGIKRVLDSKRDVEAKAGQVESFFTTQLQQKDLDIENLILQHQDELQQKAEQITVLDNQLITQGTKFTELQNKMIETQTELTRTQQELEKTMVERNEYLIQVNNAQKQTYH
jgi:hypothetical protein